MSSTANVQLQETTHDTTNGTIQEIDKWTLNIEALWEQLEVTCTMWRDLEPGKLEQILVALDDW